jgi:hypothetical protein
MWFFAAATTHQKSDESREELLTAIAEAPHADHVRHAYLLGHKPLARARATSTGFCTMANSRMGLRKLPVVPFCRSRRIPIFGNKLDSDPKSEA